MISEQVHPTDIYQGNLSVCYLLSPLSAIAEYPERLKRILGQSKPNKKGLYSVYICRIGVFEEVILDEYFPMKYGNKLKFCRTKNREIWAMLIEKAYAKVFGAYWNIGYGGGCSVNGLKDLTGAPSEIYSISQSTDNDQMWKTLKNYLARNFIIVGSTSEDKTMGSTGLAPWHAYSVLGVYEDIETKMRLIKMRNPWGKGVFRSKDERLSIINQEFDSNRVQDNGIFVMPFEDVKQYFIEMSICHYIDDYFYTQKRHKYTSNDIQPFYIEILEKGEYYITVSKPDSRFEWAGDHNSFISVVMVSAGDEGKAQYIGGVGGIHRDPFFSQTLQKGGYLAFVGRCDL